MSYFKLLLTITLSLLLASCGRLQPVMSIENMPVAAKLQTKQVKTAIIQAASDRGWTIEEASPKELIAKIHVRSHYTEVKIPYSAKSYSIIYITSKNLNAKDGMIHRNYNRWVHNLNADIRRKLALIAALN